jgi:endogenous inhibitor of DNA gyrase (YacG/DUF329 family)
MTTSRCPICARPAAPRDENVAYPFCSGRCKLIDLGNWLDGRYRIPGARMGEGDDESDGGGESESESGDDGEDSEERAS